MDTRSSSPILAKMAGSIVFGSMVAGSMVLAAGVASGDGCTAGPVETAACAPSGAARGDGAGPGAGWGAAGARLVAARRSLGLVGLFPPPPAAPSQPF